MSSRFTHLPILLLSLTVVGLSACKRDGGAAAEAATTPAISETAVSIEVETLALGPIEEVRRFSANLVAENQVSVHAQAARLVRELKVEEGDRVAKGDVLLRLQDEEQKSALAKIRAQHEKAKEEYERLKTLFERQLVSEQTYLDTKYQFQQMALGLDDATREMGYTEVRAPIGGVIAVRLVKVGNLVTIGQHLFDIVDFDSLVAPVFVPEKDLARVRTGGEARIAVPGAEGSNRGHIARVAPIVDPKTGTIKVTVALDERTGLLPGMYVDVTLLADRHEQALRVPKRALIYDKEQIFAFRLKPGERRVERIPVEVVLSDRDWVEPGPGLAPGDELVVAGQTGLKDGALVALPGDPQPSPSETKLPG